MTPRLHLCLLLITACSLCGCRDSVVRHYPTRADAAADRLFERGWLPSIIPSSSYDIRVESDLDLNLGEGHFSFDPKERLSFLSTLKKMQVSEIQESDLFRYLERGYWPYEFSSPDCTWLFLIHEEQGHCEYRMAQDGSNF